jgi:hypothetical protein
MMTPRQQFRRISWLDQFVRRFQDRWETNPQYRSLVSGLVGLVLVLTLCACTGLLTVAGNNVLASVGLTNSNSNSGVNSNTGTTQLQGAQTFPTATFGPFTNQPTPLGTPLPSSQTPPPGPTATATQSANNNPTPTTGGTNTATFICTGSNSGITWTFNPCPLVVGQAGTLTISAPGYPNTGTNIIINFGYCAKGDCTVDDPPAQGFKTDGNGVETISFVVAKDVQVGGPPVTGEINLSGGPTAGINTQGSCS